MRLLSVFVLLAFLYATSHSLSAQPDLDRIQQALEKSMADHDIPAVSLAIVYHGETYFVNRGTLCRANSNDVDEHSIYQIASLGKPFIGIVVHQLLRDGTLKLEQPITDFLRPEFKKGRWGKLETITIDHLLHHTSGLPQDVRAAYKRKDGEPYLHDYKEQDFYTDLAKASLKKPGEYSYSNFDYALLAFIAAKASGEPYEALLAKHVLSDIGAQSTSFKPAKSQANRLTTPYRKDDRKRETGYWDMGLMAPPSALYSTAADLALLLKQQLKAYGEQAESGVLSKWYLTEHTVAKGPKRPTRYGYGLAAYPGGFYGHGGDMDGYAVDYSFSPSQDFGIVILTSSGEDWINPLVRQINRILQE
ncbi:MAG: serine hydrolase domain-containing protein [Saprospiraceae bacterium]